MSTIQLSPHLYMDPLLKFKGHDDFCEEELAHVGAGLVARFQHTSDLHAMKNTQVMEAFLTGKNAKWLSIISMRGW